MKKKIMYMSDEAKDYTKQLLTIIGETEEKYFAMLDNPELFRDEWNDIAISIRETSDEDFYLADEIEEMLIELE